MDLINRFNSAHMKRNASDLAVLRPGTTVKVHQKIKEGSKTRTQIFEGLVIARKHGSGPNATITVRKISKGVGVERIFPLHMPTIEKFEIVKTSRVRRAKLYYIREKTAKETRRKTKTASSESFIIESPPDAVEVAPAESGTDHPEAEAVPVDSSPESRPNEAKE